MSILPLPGHAAPLPASRCVRRISFVVWLAGVLWLAALTCGGAADKDQSSNPQKTSGAITLPAGRAQITGPNARLEGDKEKLVAWWTHPDSYAEWTAEVQTPGRYRVEMNYSLLGVNNGGELVITVDDQKLKAIPRAGAGAEDYQTGRIGEVTLDKVGKVHVAIKAAPNNPEYVINLRSLVLVPADTPTEAIDISGQAIEPGADGSFALPAADARIQGSNAVLVDGENGAKQVGFWKDVGTSLAWTIRLPESGKYRVEMEYSQVAGDEGAKIAIAVGQQKVTAKPVPGKEASAVVTGQIGELMIAEEGQIQVVATPVSRPGPSLVKLISVALRPAGIPTAAIDIRDQPIAQAEDGSLKLVATQAEIDGEAVRLEGKEQKYLAWSNHRGKAIKWPVKFEKPGIYEITAIYARVDSPLTDQVQFSVQDEDAATLPAAPAGKNKITLKMSGQTVVHELKAGHGWEDFKTEKLGKMTVAEAGETEVVLTATERLGALVAHLQSISFQPVGE